MTRVRDTSPPRPEPCCRCIHEHICDREAPPGPEGPRFYCPCFIAANIFGTPIPGYPLPNLDREKVGKFFKEGREQIAMRDGKWVGPGGLTTYAQARADLFHELIGELVSGAWDVK